MTGLYKALSQKSPATCRSGSGVPVESNHFPHLSAREYQQDGGSV